MNKVEVAGLLAEATVRVVDFLNAVFLPLEDRVAGLATVLKANKLEVVYGSLEQAIATTEASLKEAYLVKSWRFLTLDCNAVIIQFSNGERFYYKLANQ